MKLKFSTGVLLIGLFCGSLMSCDRQESCDSCKQFKMRVIELEEEVGRLSEKDLLRRRRSAVVSKVSPTSESVVQNKNSIVDDVQEKSRKALAYLTSGDRESAHPIFKELAEDGNVEAMLYVASYYLSTAQPSEENIQKAYEWLVKAADSGDYRGAVMLVDLCRKGVIGGDDSNSLEVKWQEKAESIVNSSNDPYKFYNIGDHFRRGISLRQDTEKAMFYLEKAANAGHRGSLVRLAKIHYAEQKFDEARKLLDKAFCDDAEYALELFVRGDPPQIKAQKKQWYLSGDKADP